MGDTIRVSHYKSEGLKRLDTDARQFKVGRVVPLSEWVSDGSLSADFPDFPTWRDVRIGIVTCADSKWT